MGKKEFAFTPELDALALKLQNDGYSVTTAAKMIGCKHQTLSARLKVLFQPSGSKQLGRPPKTTENDNRHLVRQVYHDKLTKSGEIRPVCKLPGIASICIWEQVSDQCPYCTKTTACSRLEVISSS